MRQIDHVIASPENSFVGASLLENQISFVLTSKEAADLLGVSTKTLYKLVRDGFVPCKRVGKEYRFLRSQLTDWLKGG